MARPPRTAADKAASPSTSPEALGHALNNPLTSLLTNLDLLAETLDDERGDALARLAQARALLSEVRRSVNRVTEVVEDLDAKAMPAPMLSPLPIFSQVPPAVHGMSMPAPPQTSLLPTAPRTTQARPAHKLRILVLDDEVGIGNAIRRGLHGYEVVAMYDPREALDLIKGGESFDLILCDLMMPEMTGMDFYDELIQFAPDRAAEVIFLTGGAYTARAKEFVATVPNRVLAKPFDVQKLRQVVRERHVMMGLPEGVILVLDDDDAARKLVARRLAAAKFACIEHSNGPAALADLTADPDRVEALIVDVMMPGMDGFEFVEQLKANPATAAIPVIMLTAHARDEADVERGVGAGATDYITKPFSASVLVAKVRAACERFRADREVRMRLRFAEEHATIDGLTGLMNRRAFDLRLAEGVANATRYKEPLALAVLDLDHFKKINDTYGHGGGDRMLLYFARAVRRVVRIGDHAFRYGGEEFTLLLPKCDAAGAMRVVERLREDLHARPVSLSDGHSAVARFSAGIATAEASNEFRTEELVTRADAALYAAKNAGRDRTVLAD